jgi:serine acetyltransferase
MVGNNSIVGANSVVLADVPAETISTGVPAKRFRMIKRTSEDGNVYI